MWQAPNPEEVEQAYLRLSRAKSQVALVELDIELFEAENARKANRRSVVDRKFGTTDADWDRSVQLRRALVAAKQELHAAQAHVDFLEYQKDMYRLVVYSQRV